VTAERFAVEADSRITVGGGEREPDALVGVDATG
jgi:hypothetical protein